MFITTDAGLLFSVHIRTDCVLQFLAPALLSKGSESVAKLAGAKPVVTSSRKRYQLFLNDEERLKATRSEYKTHKDEKKGEVSETKWKDIFARMKEGKQENRCLLT